MTSDYIKITDYYIRKEDIAMYCHEKEDVYCGVKGKYVNNGWWRTLVTGESSRLVEARDIIEQQDFIYIWIKGIELNTKYLKVQMTLEDFEKKLKE